MEPQLYCSACGAPATVALTLAVQTLAFAGQTRQRKSLTIYLCARCDQRAARTLARDPEQSARVARALTDETRQVRQEEAYERRRTLRAALLATS